MRFVIALVAVVVLTAPATADMYNIEITGTAETVNPSCEMFADVLPGDPVTITFTLDSTDYVDDASIPSRGYVVSDFWLTIGDVTVGLYPTDSDPYFVLCDGCSAGDRLFLSYYTDHQSGF